MKLSFEDYLKKENLSQHTISVYLWTVDYFISNYKDFNTENLHAYKGYLMEFFKPKTVNLRIQAINKYLDCGLWTEAATEHGRRLRNRRDYLQSG